jgi:outer membrane protein TolC
MGQAGSGLLPQVSASYSSGKSYVQPMTVTLPPSMGGGTFSTTPNEASDSLSYSATATQTLFAGGRLLQAISTAKAGYDITGQDYIKTKNDVVFNVISSYFEILKAKKALSTIEDTLSSLDKHLRQTELFYSSGISSKADLLRSQTEVANANVSKISAQMGLELAKLSFAANLGTNIGSDFDIENIETNYFSEKETSADLLLKTAFINRPDWISYNLGMRVAKDAIAYSYGSYLPSVMYQYSAGKNKSDYKAAALKYDLDNWRSMIVAMERF